MLLPGNLANFSGSIIKKKQSVVIALGPNGNWEWGGLSFGITHQHLVIGFTIHCKTVIYEK
ncbi:MAG: hypothetical protein ACOCUQ_01615 [Bacteroidota bacterium]